MPNILKNLLQSDSLNAYIFRPAEELGVETKRERAPETTESVAPEEPAPPAETPQEETRPASPEDDPISFARIQAEAIMADARSEAEAYKQEARAAFEEELEKAREAAREEGYARGYAEGMAGGMAEGQAQREQIAAQQVRDIEVFLESAVRLRDQVLADCREELKDLAVAIAEKVIRVSLKNSGDIILRMVDAATDTHKRCAWARIYVADCDVSGKALTVPELTGALSHLAERVRVIPMPDEESGTCIVELPDAILDASVSTQLNNIKDVLSDAALDPE